MENQFECYFFVDDPEDEEAIIQIMCKSCQQEKFGYLGWYYKGELGPWEYTCAKCNKVIKEGMENNQPKA